MKKILLLLLCVLLLPLGCLAAEEYDYEDVLIDDIYYDLYYYNNYSAEPERLAKLVRFETDYFDRHDGDVVIPESVIYLGEEYRVTWIGISPFFFVKNRDLFTSISIPNGVTSIGNNAFSGCTNLTKAEFASIESLCKINFRNSTSNPLYFAHHLYIGGEEVTDLVIPESVTSIGNNAFQNCSGLTSVTIGNGVTSIGSSAFSGCTGLTSVTIGNGVTSIGSDAFSGCTGLTSVTIPESVTSIGDNAFADCTGLTKAEFTSFEHICNIDRGNAQSNPLYYAHHLYIGGKEVTKVVIPGSVETVKNWAFEGCTNFTSLKIEEGVKSLGTSAFYGNTGLVSVSIPNSMTSIGSQAFKDCTRLTKAEFASIEHVCNIDRGNAQSNPLFYAHHLYIGGKEVTNVVIPGSVETVKNWAFEGCTGFTSLKIEEGVKSLGTSAFYGNTGLTSVSLPNSMTDLGAYAVFYGCTSLTSITIPDGVTTIGERVFSNCTGLNSITIGNSVGSIGNYAFNGCTGLTKAEFTSLEHICNIDRGNAQSNPLFYAHHLYIGGKEVTNVVIPGSVETVKNWAFEGCTGFTSLKIEEGVKSLGASAFYGNTGLASVSIPNSMTSIGSQAFTNCSSLTSVILNSNTIAAKTYGSSSTLAGVFGSQVQNYEFGGSVESIGNYACYNCANLNSIKIGESITSIGDNAFNGCTGLTSVILNSNTIASRAYSSSSTLAGVFGSQVQNYEFDGGVEGIGNYACYNCANLNSIKIGENITSLGSYAFSGCSGLTSVKIPNSVTYIGYSAFSGCTGLTSLAIGSGMSQIGNSVFKDCSSLSSVSIPNNVTTIGSGAFAGCSSLAQASIGDNVTNIGESAFPTSTSLFVKKGTTSLLALWNAGYKFPYKTGTETLLPASSLNVETTQTTAAIKVNDFYSEYTNTLNGNKISSSSAKLTSHPEYNGTLTLDVSKDGVTYTTNKSYTMQPISPAVSKDASTASSLSAIGSYIEGDAKVTAQTLTLNGVTVDGNKNSITGLQPNTSYTATYTIMVDDQYTYTGTATIKTDALTLTTAQPKVINEGNIVVGATSNLDNAETNVGFQWRRTDWSDDFDSKTGGAYLYEGEMQGYIRSLNTNYLWKYRPFYTSDSGTTYYGDWKGIDPTDYSYFDPTVHTYAQTEIEGNAVQLKGYVQRGTDNVTSQGFVYWTTSPQTTSPQPSPKAREIKASAIPSGAQTVTATGTVMEASLTGLEYNTTYSYVAFVTTSEGETFYGEEQTFTTGEDPTGIETIHNSQFTIHNEGVYDLSGRKIVDNSKLKRGIYIVNGKKVMIK